MKNVLISIRPKWCEKIVSGEKPIEVRKSVPKEVPFKAYIYCKEQKRFGVIHLTRAHTKTAMVKSFMHSNI